MKWGPLLFALSVLAGFGFTGCFFLPAGCPDTDGYSYELRDGSYRGRPSASGATPPRYGSLPVDEDLTVDVDAIDETVTVSFESDGAPVEVRYAVTEVESPFYY